MLMCGCTIDDGRPDEVHGDAGPVLIDLDADGLDDAREAALAARYFPFYSQHPDDACPLHGVVYRLAPHPDDARFVMIWFDVLYDRDCGLNGHDGDNECFGVVVNPRVEGPQAIYAVRAISHQDTLCEAETTCGICDGLSRCETALRDGGDFPVVFSSRNKHGGFVKEWRCDANPVCDFGGCARAAAADAPPMVNAGEPDHPLVHDLTTDGFIREEAGWSSPSLLHHDPWGEAGFGGAGRIRDDLMDPRFVVEIEGC